MSNSLDIGQSLSLQNVFSRGPYYRFMFYMQDSGEDQEEINSGDVGEDDCGDLHVSFVLCFYFFFLQAMVPL